jgi:thioredoxin reductase (NADPH)
MKQVIDKYSVIVIGAGFAGCSAAIYVGMSRNKDTKDCAIIAGDNPGGLINTTEIVDNYLGYPGISGYELGTKMVEHAQSYADLISDYVIDIRAEGDIKIIETYHAIYKCKSVIIASGSSPRKLAQIEDALYCAICDGFLYKNKVTAVIGGGNSAFEAALYLSGLCTKVYLIHRTNQFRAFTMLQDQVKAKDNIEIITNEEAVSFNENVLQLKHRNLNGVDGVFVCIGHIPNTGFAGALTRDDLHHIEVDEYFESSIKGVFAVGDVVKNDYNQGIIAAGDGAKASLNAIKYLRTLE